MRKKILLAVPTALLAVAAAFPLQDTPPQDTRRRGPPPGGREENPLVKGLRAAEGCLGVEVAFTTKGKNVIFAWFEDKEATVDWYWGDTHQEMMSQFASEGRDPHFEPLIHVADDVGPVLCIASLTPAGEGSVEGVDMPISQISIEMYTPLPGGLSVGGTFAPATLQVPHMLRVPGLGQEGAPPPGAEDAGKGRSPAQAQEKTQGGGDAESGGEG